MTPDEALDEARRRAAAAREAGVYDDADEVAKLGRRPPREPLAQLYDWAIIEPDVERVVSTRRLSWPITAFKRGLVRLLRQYHQELEGQQTRFNIHFLAYTSRLERRVAELEAREDDEPPA